MNTARDTLFKEFREGLRVMNVRCMHEMKERNKNKCIEYKNSKGYDNLYIVLDKEFNTDEDEFEATSDQTKSQITRAFKKYSSSKKVNKSLMTKFGQAVA